MTEPRTPDSRRRSISGLPVGRPAGGRRTMAPRSGWWQVRYATATAIVIITTVAAIVLALHIVFVVFTANDANSMVSAINRWADRLAWNFRDVFTPRNPQLATLVNYGFAAAVYLIGGRILAALIRRAG